MRADGRHLDDVIAIQRFHGGEAIATTLYGTNEHLGGKLPFTNYPEGYVGWELLPYFLFLVDVRVCVYACACMYARACSHTHVHLLPTTINTNQVH